VPVSSVISRWPDGLPDGAFWYHFAITQTTCGGRSAGAALPAGNRNRE